MFKITVTDMETGAIRQETTGERIIAAASTHGTDEAVSTDIIRVHSASSLTIAHAINSLVGELNTICADDIDIAVALAFVRALSKSAEEQEEENEDE